MAPPLEFTWRTGYAAGVSEAVVTGWLAAGTVAALACMKPAPDWRPTARVHGWIAGLIAAAMVSIAARGDPLPALPALSRAVLGGLAFLACGCAPGESRERSVAGLAAGLAAGGAAAGWYALWQRGVGIEIPADALATLRALNPGLAAQVEARVAAGRAFSFFVYPNTLAGFLIMALPFAVQGWRAAPQVGMRRWAFAGAAALAALGLVASGSVGAAACLAAAFGMAAWRRPEGGGRAIAAGAVALAAIVLVGRPEAIGAAASTKVAHWAAAIGRPTTWREAVCGAGPGAYHEAVFDAMPRRLWAAHAHNWIVETWVEGGVIGTVALVGLLVAVLAAAWRAAGRGGWPAAAATASVAGAGHALVDFDYADPTVSFVWWVIAGVLVAAGGTGPGRPAARGAARGRWAPAWAVAGPAAVILALLRGSPAVLCEGLVLGAGTGWLCFRAWRGAVPVRLGRGDALPWVTLAVAAAWWALVSPAADPAVRAALEAAGLGCVAALVRTLVGGRPDEERRLRTALLVITGAAGAAAAVQGLTGGGSAALSFPSPNFLAAFLVFGFGLAAGAIGGKGSGSGLLLWTAAGAGVAGIVATRSGGAGLAAAALTIWLALGPGYGRPGGYRWRRAVAATGAVVAAVAAAFLFVDAADVAQRLALWREAARLLVRDPFGSGPGRYASMALAVQEPSVTAAAISRYSLAAQWAHCEPLQFAVEWGLPALGLAAWGACCAWRAGRRGPGRAWAAALAGVALHGFVDFPFRAPVVSFLAAVAVGAAGAGTTGRRVAPVPARPAVGAGGTAVAAAICGWLVIVWCRPALSRIMLELAAPDRGSAVANGERALGGWPLNPEGWLRRADVLAQLAGTEGEDAARAAVSLAGGSYETRMALGRVLLDRGIRRRREADLAAAREAFALAARAAPHRPQPWVLTARAWMAERDWERADAAVASALAQEPFCLEARVLRGMISERRGRLADARREYRRTLVLHAQLIQRPGPNEYERSLLGLDPGFVRGRLIELGGGR